MEVFEDGWHGCGAWHVWKENRDDVIEGDGGSGEKFGDNVLAIIEDGSAFHVPFAGLEEYHACWNICSVFYAPRVLLSDASRDEGWR